MKVFLGLTEIAGYYRGLAEGFEALGHECEHVDLSEHPFDYGGAEHRLVGFHKRGRRFGRSVDRVGRMALLSWAAARFDLFIFGYNTSFLGGYRDVHMLRRLGKKVIFQFHGSDSRPPYLNGSYVTKGLPVADGVRLAAERKRTVALIDQCADHVIDTPAGGHFHERPFVVWLRVGLPVRPAILPRRKTEGGPLRILHSPSNPRAKGTERIRAIVKAVGAARPIELVELTDRPNAEVLQALADCDLVIDQAYADYGMPGFSTEAAWYGKPVLIGGYAEPLWRSLLPEAERPPTHYCHPDQLADGLQRLVTDDAYRIDLGRRARAFVETRWQPTAVAQRYLDLLEGRPEWHFDPSDIDYWQGCGLPEDEVRRSIAAVVEAGGPSALQLDDKPALRRRLLYAARAGRRA